MLGTSKISCEMIRYAQSIGVYTIVADPHEPKDSIAKQLSDEHWEINLADVDALEKKCVEEKVNGVICGVSEFALKIWMELSKRLGYPCYCTPDAWHYSEDKDDFKNLCKKTGVRVPTDYYVSPQLLDEEIEKIEFPVVVKPVDQNGNRGVSYCYIKEELKKAYKYARSVSKSEKIIIEKMIVGEEWWSSYACVNGEVRLVALNAMYAQPGEPANCYTIATTVSSHVNQFIKEVNPQVEKLLKEVGCRDGFAWVQEMLDKDGNFYIIEMGYRLDGVLMFLPYKELCGYDVVKDLVDLSLGKKFSTSDMPIGQTGVYKKCGCGMELWVNKSGTIKEIKGLDEMKKIPGVFVESLVRIGDEVGQYRSCGNILFTTDNCEQMCEMIDKVNRTVSFINEKGEDIVIKYTNFDYLKKIYNDSLKEC